jgi:phage-related baseplate assembly protein
VVIAVTNLETTAGGAEVEDDESFRDRIHMAPEKFTTAGSEQSYIYWARSARPGIADVSPDSPSPGVVHLYILLDGGVIPDADGPEIKDVVSAVSGEKVRPLTDLTKVFPAIGVDVDFTFTYYLTKQQAAYADIISENVKKATANYETWQTRKIGRDVNPDELVRACRAAGVKRIEPYLITRETTPGDGDGEEQSSEVQIPLQFMQLTKKQVARIPAREKRIIFGGVEEE